MSTVIITPKEDVDYQFWYPKRNRVINEYKYIKDNYSWSDEVEKESEYATGATSPKIYDLRTPQRNREQKRRIQASFPIIRIQATLQIWWSNQLKIINLRDTPNLRGNQNLQWIQNLQTQCLQIYGDLLRARKHSFLLWTEF